ncbi:glycoside hydrolase family 18 protein [Phanerochaete carnosa HHB-10118-sp]|uniref:Glycoside hydrolase family 18 protein n=1 Tax=Phanerochaete carnosa (strain HHB-10118-sp) TaxID=650164 RepID=K5VZP7_PHACS|nr:glycoside hydrolase family 18 protein [Phanerochaete carnosa HHB-10118-sp]EKM57063.1 glycoside hydrolase family 18 protein [Phanerochaete carnosa HHB-10118-sp]
MLYMLPLALLLVTLSSAWAAPMCSLRSASSAAASPTPSSSPAGGSSLTPPATSGSGNSSNNDIVATAWYTGWNSAQLPVSQVSWDKYTSMTYAFALPQSDGTILLQSSDVALLPQFVEAAHSHNTKALLTIGGWTGSMYFSSLVGNADNRTAFVNASMQLVNQYNLDGLDFDWEYPGSSGDCNVNSPDDTQNFLSFLQELRGQASNLTLSAAVSLKPWVDSSGNPSTDVSGFAKALDYIAIMDYDVFGPGWSNNVGPNAPLNDTCAPSGDQDGSAVSAVNAWTASGFPANQIVLALAAYGHGFVVNSSTAFDSSNIAASASSTSSAMPAGTTPIAAYPTVGNSSTPEGDSTDAWSPGGGVDECGRPTSPGWGGIWNFAGMITGGVLDQNGTAVSGVGYRFDTCSQTPYVYLEDKQTMISYDDPTSIAAKGQFIAEQGLRGFAIWEAAGDYNDLLLDAVSNAIGIEEH